MEGIVLLCLATVALSMIGLVFIVGCVVIAGVDIIQEKIIKRFFPKKYYYDYEEI